MTDEHPFYVAGQGWTPARALDEGNTLFGADGTLAVIAIAVKARPDGVAVYNLEVEQAHTYFVLAEDAGDSAAVWVHNAEGYITATDRRRLPGVASMSEELPAAQGMWLQADRSAGIPRQVADRLVGREFNSLAELRSAIWTEIGKTSELLEPFKSVSIGQMKRGFAPFAPREFQTGIGQNQLRFNLHHVDPIESGGAVFDLSKLRITSPLVHNMIHG